ncbi:hypothetical protein [Gimesia aquarii]|uniref:Uncharacterized protein n=1 Tax=Gimesia aquarii TaxID=2527964 RepID=A0A517X2Y4_9PLAN|nr:hypothetical protein [Gimesia aquarii]QDU11866.1 hypothetical protein V202x_52910 [Gimesia aquarii]
MYPINESIQVALMIGCSFCSIGLIAWFFSSRPKAYIRTFVPKDEMREVARSLLRDEQWTSAMRKMAKLQIGLGIILAFIVLLFSFSW